ncbi:2Fe-2S iron-sulfur cluster-binding protein [Paraburkholderia phymatum]|uniref:2Fe-2S iron-sulfur cluster-binding protein n=1 Tax=Paraburkholderia phymatum TaxID=148447 RepID=UPI003180076A
MIQVTFIHKQNAYTVQGEQGQSVMQLALAQQVPGILADCGGCLTCGTCQAYIEAPWSERLPAPSEDEAMMIDGLLNTAPTSRLACQIVLRSELDGLVVHLPDSQL